MKTKLEQVLAHCLKGREVAVWGQPTRLLTRELQGFPWHLAKTVDPARHYVLAVTDDDLTDFERDEQHKGFRDVWDFICFSDLFCGCKSCCRCSDNNVFFHQSLPPISA